MPHIVSVPHRELVLAERRGSFTVPDQFASLNCNCAFHIPCEGIPLDSLGQEHAALSRVARERAKTMVRQLAKRGQMLHGDLRLHGPWVSYGFEERLADVDSDAWRRAQTQKREDGLVYEDPSQVAGMVFERDPSYPFSDYLLVGYFEMREERFDEPVKVEDYPW